MHLSEFKILKKLRGLHPFAEVNDPLPLPPPAFTVISIVPILGNDHCQGH